MTSTDEMLRIAASLVEGAGVFGEITFDGAMLCCHAVGSAAHAEYRIERDGGRLWVSLVTPDRWLSQSIEADLMFTGDKLEELIEEELVDQGYNGPPPIVEHFRSEDKLFTFRTPLPEGIESLAAAETGRVCAQFLLAYQAAFAELGDMKPGEDDE